MQKLPKPCCFPRWTTFQKLSGNILSKKLIFFFFTFLCITLHQFISCVLNFLDGYIIWSFIFSTVIEPKLQTSKLSILFLFLFSFFVCFSFRGKDPSFSFPKLEDSSIFLRSSHIFLLTNINYWFINFFKWKIPTRLIFFSSSFIFKSILCLFILILVIPVLVWSALMQALAIAIILFHKSKRISLQIAESSWPLYKFNSYFK